MHADLSLLTDWVNEPDRELDSRLNTSVEFRGTTYRVWVTVETDERLEVAVSLPKVLPLPHQISTDLMADLQHYLDCLGIDIAHTPKSGEIIVSGGVDHEMFFYQATYFLMVCHVLTALVEHIAETKRWGDDLITGALYMPDSDTFH